MSRGVGKSQAHDRRSRHGAEGLYLLPHKGAAFNQPAQDPTGVREVFILAATNSHSILACMKISEMFFPRRASDRIGLAQLVRF